MGTALDVVADPPRAVHDEPLWRRLARRCITIPTFAGVAVLLLVAAPLWLPCAVVVDLLRRTRFSSVRALTFLTALFWLEVLGVAIAFAIAPPRLFRFVDEERFLAWNTALQTGWVRALYTLVLRIFSLEVEVSGQEHVAGGPLYVLIRHVSVGDTLFPGVFVTGATGLRLRYVLKDELLWDPCLDVVGHRLPNAFVRRESGASDTEIEKVRLLARQLSSSDGVLVFPEGTRFTPSKRARALEKLASRDPALVPLAERLTHVLPPKVGGVLALLEEDPRVDVLFCAHAGLDGIETIGHLFDGSLVGRRVTVKFWRVSAETIPSSTDARVRWLFDEWAQVSRVVAEHAARHPVI